LWVIIRWPDRGISIIKYFLPPFTIFNRIREGLDSLGKSIKKVTELGGSAFAKAVAWSLCAHFIVIVGIIIIANGISTPYDTGGIIFTYAITTAGAVLLFLLPGSYIGWDALFFGLLVASAGISPEHSLVIVAIVRVQQLLFMILGGISLNWLLHDTSKSVIYEEK
jgi:hypothetical protein